jgi:hypothetical protein
MNYAFIDDVPVGEPTWDSLIEYRAEDFDEFKCLVKDLCEFRNQAQAIQHTYMKKVEHVKRTEVGLASLDALAGYLENDDTWKEKVKELKEYYTENIKYEELKAELKEIEKQKEHVETIKKEFKVQTGAIGICAICSDRPVSLFLDPCGHTSCQECLEHLTPRRDNCCPFCRGLFTQKRLFLA